MTQLYKADGTRVTEANIATTAVVFPATVTLDDDLYVTKHYGAEDDSPEGKLLVLFGKAGKRVLQSVVDGWFPTATATAIAPATGVAAGGDTVVITGTNLDGVTAITFDGAAATAVEVLSTTEVQCVTPAGTAGTADVVLTDDSGTVTKTAFFTYT